MGVTSFQLRSFFSALVFAGALFPLLFGQVGKQDQQPSLAESYNAGAPEVEPVVVGRERWNEKPAADNAPTTPPSSPAPTNDEEKKLSTSGPITELPALETQQVKPELDGLPLDPPKNLPATKIVRNFDGTLVFKPRKYGFATDFPYQLENSKGKRLAFVDMDHLKAVDPQDFVGKSINVMGKLESIEEGSDERVIRARILRPSN